MAQSLPQLHNIFDSKNPGLGPIKSVLQSDTSCFQISAINAMETADTPKVEMSVGISVINSSDSDFAQISMACFGEERFSVCITKSDHSIVFIAGPSSCICMATHI